MAGDGIQKSIEVGRPRSVLEAGIGDLVEIDVREKPAGRCEAGGAMAVAAEKCHSARIHIREDNGRSNPEGSANMSHL